MSFVASCHYKVVQCFRMVGNTKHEDADKEVSLAEFQAAVRSRHSSSPSSSDGGEKVSDVDFQG